MPDNRTTSDFLSESLQLLDQALAGLKDEQSEFLDEARLAYRTLEKVVSDYEDAQVAKGIGEWEEEDTK